LNHAKSEAKNDDHTINIEATRHLMTLNESQSIKYLETVALPFYRAHVGNFIFSALDTCDILESQYRKRGAARKADAIAIMQRNIYKGMIYGPNDIE